MIMILDRVVPSGQSLISGVWQIALQYNVRKGIVHHLHLWSGSYRLGF